MSAPVVDPHDTPPAPPARARGLAARAALASGLASTLWLVPALWPGSGVPAWPSASLGLVALGLAGRPGPPLSRAVGAFLGLVGLLGGLAQVGILWGLSEIVSRTPPS